VKPRFAFVLAALSAATIIATMRGGRSRVSLGSIRQLCSDALRDADRPGMELTRLSDAQEMQLGAELVSGAGLRPSPESVWRVAAPLVRHVHRLTIRYEFHLLDTPAVNAFALPGGQIIVTTGMLDFVQSDDELAMVLGHEIAHVDLRHAVGRYQYQYRLGGLAELVHRLFTMPFSADQELDADAEGLRLAVAAGYDRAAGPALYARMAREFHEPASDPPATPAGEVASSLADLLVSYYRTHPPSEERARRLSAAAP
jgi:beta-barrel assembly-enhancing protease